MDLTSTTKRHIFINDQRGSLGVTYATYTSGSINFVAGASGGGNIYATLVETHISATPPNFGLPKMSISI